MRAAFYERSGAARDVLRVEELPTPTPGPGEVRVRIAWSGVNPSDVKSDGGVTGKRVLVAGGAGAVGHYALQLARLMGARQLLTTVSGPEKGELARAAGADVVVNYRTEDAAARVMRPRAVSGSIA